MPKATLATRRVPTESLVLDPANARQHPQGNLDAITASLQRFGQAEPLVIQKGTNRVIAGNGRLVAMRKLGWTECDVVEVEADDLTATALGIALNRTAELAEWDDAVLARLLRELEAEGAADSLGFSEDDMKDLLDRLADEATGECEEDEVPEPMDEAVSRPGDVWLLGEHRLLCGDSSKREDVDRLLAGARIHLVNTDPPYNVKVEPRSNNAIAAGLSSFPGTSHHQSLDLARHPGKSEPTTAKMRPKDRPLMNDFLPAEEFERMLLAWFGNLAYAMEPGASFYIWGGYANCANYPPALKASGLYFSQSIIWNKLHPVLTRKDFMGAHEWCQPAGTRVLTPEGDVPIESLRDGDRVVSYSRHHNLIIGTRTGSEVACASRPYDGPLLGIDIAGQTTWCTPAHLWTARLTEAADAMWCVYLMRKGRWWRAGTSKLITTWGFGVKQRLYTEDGDAVWILSTHTTSLDAALEEQVILAEYGIPLVTWSETAASRRTIADVARLYDVLDLDRMQQSALRALAEHGRILEHPLLTQKRTRIKVSRRVSTLVRACNLLPGVMSVPVPGSGLDVRWETIWAIDRQPFEGKVYSMDVAKHGHYIADGIVTHNCFYGWREGAGHQFYGPNNATDLWELKKINPQSMIHLTEKPVELAVRAIEYSSKRGGNVLDLFGGSGSTAMACEHTGRRGFLMELDPIYCDVIVRRWEQKTGNTARLEKGGRSFDEVAADGRPGDNG